MANFHFSIGRAIPLIFVVAIAVVAVIAALRSTESADGSSNDPRVELHAFAAPREAVRGLSGERFTRADGTWREVPAFDPNSFVAEPWVLHVWASWCVACRYEAESLQRLAEIIPGRLAGLAYIDRESDVVRFAEKYGMHYDALGIDGRGDAGLTWGVSAVPETLLIDAQGIVRWRFRGALTLDIVNGELSRQIALHTGQR